MQIKSPLFTASLVVLALSCLILLFPTLAASVYKIPNEYNEGWITAHTVTAMAGENIYHHPDKYLINNYPPLYPYIAGIAGELFGDHIFPARVLSAVSFFALALLIFIIVRSLTKQIRPAIFSALLFIALMAGLYPKYIASCDNQLPANVFSLGALAAFILLPVQKKNLIVVAGLFLVSGLIKHIVVVIPIALTIFIFLRHRRYFYYWIGLCSSLVGTAVLIIYMLYGSYFFDSMASARSYGLFRMFARTNQHLWGLAAPLAFLAITFMHPLKSRFNTLLYIVFFTGLFTGVVFMGGAGTSYNLFFDLCIALSIICGLNLQCLAELLPAETLKRDAAIALTALALAITPFMRLPLATAESIGLLDELEGEEKATAADIAFLSEHNPPAICETMSLCYWAGLPVEYDAFNTGQAMRKSPALEKEILEKISSKHFSVIQLLLREGQLMPERFPDAFLPTVKENYDLARTNGIRIFFTPKQHDHLTMNRSE